MKKTFPVILFFLLGMSLFLYFLQNNEKEKINLFSRWHTFSPQSELFSVSFPYKPHYGKEILPIPGSDLKRRYDMYASENMDGTVFLVTVATYPDNIDINQNGEKMIRENIDELVSNHSENRLAKVDSEVFKGYQALSFNIQNGEHQVEGKALKDGNRVYILTYSPFMKDKDQDEYQYFIDSFRILKSSPANK